MKRNKKHRALEAYLAKWGMSGFECYLYYDHVNIYDTAYIRDHMRSLWGMNHICSVDTFVKWCNSGGGISLMANNTRMAFENLAELKQHILLLKLSGVK